MVHVSAHECARESRTHLPSSSRLAGLWGRWAGLGRAFCACMCVTWGWWSGGWAAAGPSRPSHPRAPK
eukprot:6950883-Prymnesium_polylepis.1